MTSGSVTDLRDHVHAVFAGRVDSLPDVGPDARARIVTLDDATRLTAWRNEHRAWFFTQFVATSARTRAWLEREVIGRPDRVLFVLAHDTDGLPFGHLGLTNADLPRRRVEVDHGLPLVVLPSLILNELVQHARETGDEECCGLLVGDDQQRFRRCVRCLNTMTHVHEKDPVNFPRDARAGYYIDPHEYDRIEREAKAAGQEITAVYHSHVGVGAYLSELDLEYAESAIFPFPAAAQIVLGMANDKVSEAGFFERECPGKPFSGRPIKLMGL